MQEMTDLLFRIVRKDSIKACLVLALLIVVSFFPEVVGTKTLMLGAWDVPSIMQSGAYGVTPPKSRHVGRTPDPGAPAWMTEPLFKIESQQYAGDGSVPLWNPHSGYGTPLAAAMQPQPFYPLAMLLALHPTPYTYNLFVLARLFVAGMFMFLFMRWFLPFLPSIFSAVAFMLTGYFINYLNMPHLSVEVLLPAVFWAFEGVLRRKSFGATAAAAAVVMMAILGGMPESTFLILTFGYVYFLVRMFLDAEFAREKTIHLRNFILVNLFGFALAAFLLFPFIEFMRNSHDVHQSANLGALKSGTIYDPDPRNMLDFFLPYTYGRGIMANYLGLLPVLFAIFALGGYFPRNRKSLEQSFVQISLFFGVAIILLLLKRFGFPVVNWVGGLPLFDMVFFLKYHQPLVAFSLAALAGFGFNVFMEGKVGPRFFFISIGCVSATVLGLSICSFRRALYGKFPWVFPVNLILALLFLLIVARAYRRFFKDGEGFSELVQRGTVALLALEMSFFLAASFYLFNTMPPVKANPYSGAPYMTFLKNEDTDRSRVFARDGLLYPNWAGVFDLDDVRSLDGMYYRRYIRFIRYFLLKPGDETRVHDDLADRFTGSDPGYSYDFDSDAEKRFLELSSIRYLIAIRDYRKPSLVKDIFAQHRQDNIRGLAAGVVQLEGKTIPILFQDPPSHQVAYRATIDDKKPVLEFCVLVRPEDHEKNEGVGFLLELRTDGRVEKLFSATLTPKTRPADREAVYHRIDLSQYAGREVELLFSTDLGQGVKKAYGAGWGAVRFTSEQPASSPFHEIYNDEVKIFEFPHVLPRATIYRGIELLEDEDSILTRLKDPSFDIWKNALVWGKTLSLEDRKRLQEIGPARDGRCASALIVSYQSRRVVIEAPTEEPSLLMLNDANYPGWKVYVDGRPESILNVDYLFRGVILPAGTSTVEFVYRPLSFVAGTVVSLLAVIALLALFVVKVKTGNKIRM